ncbi:MAG TPA: hypothetical protein VHZ26_16595 [Caulobacteraceae bacterium]|jgi:hypothetical protein|nr:hypothetical protein [Caulobacteraceae bacterium]
MAKHTAKSGSNGKTHKKVAGSVLGVTRDGVRILNQGKATHFTQKELREAIRSVQASKRAG